MSTKTLAPSVVTDRDPKGMKFMAICAAAYNKAELTDGPVDTPEGEAQRVNEAEGLSDLIAQHIAKNRTIQLFVDEEVPSKYGYLSGYTRPIDIIPQTNKLRQMFKGLGFANQDLLKRIEKRDIELPKGTEGWFAIPNWMKNPGIFGKTYSEAVQKVLDTIKETRGRLYNYREGSIDEAHLRQSARSVEAWKKIAEEQGNPDILIVAGQFGLRHRGRSVRRALAVMPKQGEFGLGAFALGCMLLTHENRLQDYNDLWIDCAGDEFSPLGVGRFSRAPYLGFGGGGVGFGTSGVGFAFDFFGSASGFFPQS